MTYRSSLRRRRISLALIGPPWARRRYRQSCRAWVTPRLPALAVYRQLTCRDVVERQWSVGHVPSGRWVQGGFPDLGSALRFIGLVSNWPIWRWPSAVFWARRQVRRLLRLKELGPWRSRAVEAADLARAVQRRPRLKLKKEGSSRCAHGRSSPAS